MNLERSVTKPLGYVIGEQLRNLWDFFSSKIPSFTLPMVSASSPACTGTSSKDSCETPNSCRDPIGSYKSSCRQSMITYIPHENTCQLTTVCNTMFEAISEKSNELKYHPNKIVVLGNNNGTLTVLDLLEKGSTPEEANSKLEHHFEALKDVDQKLLNLALPEGEKEKLTAEKDGLLNKKREIIGGLSSGDVITVDADRRTRVLTFAGKENHVKLYSKDAYKSFNRLAGGAGGIMGLSPSSNFLPLIIEEIFEHILKSAQHYKALDIAFILDTTGSMEDDIDQVKINLLNILLKLKAIKTENPTIFRVALVEYRDALEKFLHQVDIDFTTDLDTVIVELNKVYADAGGDLPEAVYDAIVAASDLSWDPEAKHVALVIGDAAPHERTIDNRYGEEEIINLCQNQDIQLVVYPILTVGV